MVCKEEVFTWFQNLQAHKRIETMYVFLNMCYPLELRFCGTCLEDLARKEYYVLREKELEANNITEVSKIRNIHDQQVRNHLIIVLSLLNSSNTLCAKELFRILSEEIKLDVLASLRIFSDSKLLEQYLLLLALAQHHPAFNFVQQNYLAELSTSIENYARELSPRTKYECEERCSQAVYPYVNSVSGVPGKDVRDGCNTAQSYRSLPPVHRRASDYYQNLVRITNLKVKPPHRKQSIRIRESLQRIFDEDSDNDDGNVKVSWSSNKPTDTFKTPKELMVFHQKLIESYPNEAKGTTNQDKYIPPFPQTVVVASQLNPLSDVVITALTEYIEQLNARLPGYILENDFVTSFFLPSNHTRTVLIKGNRSVDIGQGDIHSRNSRLRSLTIYNSQMGDNSSGHRPDCRQKVVHNSLPRKHSENGSSCGRTSPLTSPLQSPSSSPYASPISSETNSRAGSPWNSIAGPYFERNASSSVSDASVIEKVLVKEQIQEQWDTARKIEEIQGLPIEELQALGILRDDSSKKVFNMKSPPNGIINACISKSLNSQKPSLLMQHSASNDSSPVCSEYSSPPQSPSPAEGCNQSTSLSSSNEENLDKRTVIKTLPDLLKIQETDHSQNIYDSNFKRTDDDAVSLKSSLNRTTISVIPFPSHYSSIISQIPPQNMKPAYLPIPCRTNNAPQHMSPNAVVFDNPLRVPLPSALTYLQGPPRSHAVTPDRVLSTPNIPISSVSPFPVVTSGCATLPSATCCITSHKSSTVTVVTNSAVSSNRHTQKNPSMRDSDVKPVPQPGETAYASAFILSSSAQLTPASCSCFTTNSARPSPAPSPSMSPGATPQQPAVPVSLPYLGMPYVFHHSIPFLTAQASANGFVPQPGISNPGQSFGFAALNGLATLPPELVYPAQTFALQSPSTQGNPGQVASPGSQCYGAFPQTAAVPVKLMPSTSCCNCGKMGHRGADCKEPTMDDLNKTGKFQLNYTPIPKIPDE